MSSRSCYVLIALAVVVLSLVPMKISSYPVERAIDAATLRLYFDTMKHPSGSIVRGLDLFMTVTEVQRVLEL